MGDRVWLDVNGDGLQDCVPVAVAPLGAACEPGIDGVAVALLNANGVVVATTTTSNGGFYTFTNLLPGTYVVSFTLPSGYWFTTMDAMTNTLEALDSDANPVSGATNPFVLAAGEINPNIDAGLLAAPLLAASKSSVPALGTTVHVGDSITYTVWFTNLATTIAFHVPVTDSAPDGTAYIPNSAVPPVVSGPSPLVWDIAAVMPGVPYSVSFSVIVTGVPALGTIVNVAFVGDNPVTETNEIVHVFAPTAVQLVSLRASRGMDLDGNPIVSIAWAVASESDTLGYRVLRSETADRSSASLVTTGLIAALGDGGTYAWIDTSALTSRTYFYWVEVVDLDGNAVNDFGPAVAPPEQQYRAYLPVIR